MAISDVGKRIAKTLGSRPYLIGAAAVGLAFLALASPLAGFLWWLIPSMLGFVAGIAYSIIRQRRDSGPPPPLPEQPLTRSFFFLDPVRIRGLLSQYEWGKIKGVTEKRMELIQRGLVAGINVGVGQVGGASSTQRASETARSMEPTTETAFNLLHAYLCHHGLLRAIDLYADKLTGHPPEPDQFYETTVDSSFVFHPQLRRTVNINTPRVDAELKLAEEGTTPDTEDAQGKVIVMGRVTGSHNLPGNRIDLTIRVFAIYR